MDASDLFGHSIEIYEASQEDIDAFEWPMGTIESIYLDGDAVAHFAPPPCQLLTCNNVGLRSLDVPEGVEILRCDGNCLKELVLPASITTVHANNNRITRIRPCDPVVGLPKLHTLRVGGRNRISSLEFEVPQNLGEIELTEHPEFSDAWKRTIELGHNENMQRPDKTDYHLSMPELTEEEMREYFAQSKKEFIERFYACPQCGHHFQTQPTW